MGLFGSLSWALSQRALWLGRANNAWGISRAWNSGTSFETDSATWQGRANTAYDSGVWGSGNTWQADYTATVPAGSGATPEETTLSLAAGGPSGGAVWTGSSWSVTRTGHYVATWSFSPNSTNSPSGQVVLLIRKAGVQQGSAFTTAAPTGLQSSYNGWAEFDANAGDVMDLFCSSQTGSNGSASAGTLKYIYIPTPTHPH